MSVAEGVKLSTGMYLVMFLEKSEIMFMNDDQMCASIESGARLRWSL